MSEGVSSAWCCYVESTGAAGAGCLPWAASSLARVREGACIAPEMLSRSGRRGPFDFSWVIGRQETCTQVSSQARRRFRLDRLLHALLCHWSNCDSRYAQIATKDLENCNNASFCSMPPGRRKRAPCTGLNTAAQARRPQQGEQGRRDEEAAGLGAADAQRDAVWKSTSGSGAR